MWCCGVVVITTAQLHSTKPELRLCAGSDTALGMPEIRAGDDLWQWSRLEIRLNAFRWSTISQKQFIIITIITEKLPESIESSRFISHRARMSGEFDSRKDLQSLNFKRRPQIFVKLSFRELCNSQLSGLHAFDNMAIIHKVKIG